MIEADEILKNQDIIVVYKEGWHKGVLGIVASASWINITGRQWSSLLKTGWALAQRVRSTVFICMMP